MFTKDTIKELAEAAMTDITKLSFVTYNGGRIPCVPRCMAELGLVQGQTITDGIFVEIMKWHHADCVALIAEDDLAATAVPGKERRDDR